MSAAVRLRLPSSEAVHIKVHWDAVNHTLPAADVWECFLVSRPALKLKEMLLILDGTKDEKEHADLSEDDLPDLAALCQNKMLHGVSLFGVLLVCYRSKSISKHGRNCRKPSKLSQTTPDRLEINILSQMILTEIHSSVQLAGVEVMDQQWRGYVVHKPLLARGSFGRVWKATRRRDGVTCAIKEITDWEAADAEQKTWVQREVQLLLNINSPHVVRYYQSFEREISEGGRSFCIVCEYCNSDLNRFLLNRRNEGQPLTEEEMWSLCLGTMAGLYVLRSHGGGVQHRDLKPSNYLVVHNGLKVKLADLGLAKEAEMASSDQSTHRSAPWYKSPEKFRGQRYKWPADIWALGCTMYVICSPTMTHPFKPDEARLLTGVYSELPDSVPQLLQSIIADCLKIDPEARPTVMNILRRVLGSGRQIDPDLAHQLQAEVQLEEKGEERMEDANEVSPPLC